MELLLYGHYTKAWKLKKLCKLNPVKLPFHELIIVLSGSLHYTVDNVDLTISDGEIAYIPMGHTCARQATSSLTDYLSIDFLQDEPLPFFGKLPFTADPCILHLIASADHLWKSFQPNALPLIKPLMEFLLTYLAHTFSLPQKSAIVKKMEEFLHANIRNQFCIKDLANHLFLSVPHCHAIFKREMGMPIKMYFNNLRLQEAKQLLSFNELSLAEIAEELCFYDSNYFSRLFKKYFGVTPSQYRKTFNPSHSPAKNKKNH